MPLVRGNFTFQLADYSEGRMLTPRLDRSLHGLLRLSFSRMDVVASAGSGYECFERNRVWRFPSILAPRPEGGSRTPGSSGEAAPAGEIPEWFLQLAEAMAEKRVNPIGVAEDLSPSDFLLAVEGLEVTDAHPDIAAVASWLIRRPTGRTVSPFSDLLEAEYIRGLLNERTAESAMEALRLEPEFPAAIARIAWELLADGVTVPADYYSALAGDLAPDDEEVSETRAAILAITSASEQAEEQ